MSIFQAYAKEIAEEISWGVEYSLKCANCGKEMEFSDELHDADENGLYEMFTFHCETCENSIALCAWDKRYKAEVKNGEHTGGVIRNKPTNRFPNER